MKFTPYVSLFSALVSLALTGGLVAQTAPKSTGIDDGDSSLLIPSGNQDDDASVKAGDVKPDADVPEPDVSVSVDPAKPVQAPSPTQKTADEGIQIQVEKSTGKSGAMNQPGAVKVYSPWPAKPLAQAPAGWKFAPAPTGLAPFKTTVKLGDGNSVALSITPFVLVPVSDGINAIRIAEPGYDPAQQYVQKDTVGTMLQKSTVELEENEKHAAEAISRLQQLLSSLPQQ